MQFETAFNVGDRGWIFTENEIRLVTIGQIRVKYTGKSNELYGPIGDNYGPQKESYVEEYMCYEHGIGSGSVFTLGKSIFATKEGCEIQYAEEIERKRLYNENLEKEQHQTNLRLVESCKMELARLQRKVEEYAARA